jgi:predicted membrane protein
MLSAKSMKPSAWDKRTMTAVIRTASFLAALVASLALMLFPFLLRHVPEVRLHAALPIMLVGVVGVLVYGVGYTPDNRLLRVMFGPICAWIMIMSGALLLAIQ